MTLSNGNDFRVIGPLCEETTGHRWITSQRASNAGFDVFFDVNITNVETNSRVVGDLRRQDAHCDVTVLEKSSRLV